MQKIILNLLLRRNAKWIRQKSDRVSGRRINWNCISTKVWSR